MDYSAQKDIKEVIRYVLFKDKKFFTLIATYGIIVALLNLALPISIQLLINSVIYTTLISPVMILGVILLFLLSFSAILSILQKFLIEVYNRNSFVRLSSDILLKAIYSEHDSFLAYNTSDLSSRYFEIFNIQRYASELIVEGFLVFLTMLVSFILSSFYHPYFLILNLIIVFFIFCTWGLFSKVAIRHAVARSKAKCATFAWIDDVFRMSTFFKSAKNKEYAINKGRDLIKDYIYDTKKYWNISFTQLIILMVIYVMVTISLIIFGSILVIKGQLSLGQLVAAEILYATSMYGVSKLSIYFDKYYNLLASVDKMSHIFKIKNEQIGKVNNIENLSAKIHADKEIIKFNHVHYLDGFGTNYKINLSIIKGSSNLVLVANQNIKSIFVKLLVNLTEANSGFVEFNGIHIADFDQHFLRDQIILVDNVDMFGSSVGEFLDYGISLKMRNQLNDVLEAVGLNHFLRNLPDGFDTELIGNGYPLLEQHIVLLKIAKAILSEPMVIVITDIFDKVDEHLQEQILRYIANETSVTLVSFSENVDNHIHYNNFILLTENETHLATTTSQFHLILNQLQDKGKSK